MSNFDIPRIPRKTGLSGGLEKLKEQWNDNPLLVIGVVGAAFKGVSSIINAVSAAQGRRAYAKQINHRVKKPKS